jgi:hypothetical protein
MSNSARWAQMPTQFLAVTTTTTKQTARLIEKKNSIH